MALPSAGSRALGKPDPALGKSSKTYPKRRFPDSHTAHAHTPVHRRPPACAAAACPPALPPPVPARPPPPSAVRSHRCRPYARTAAARPAARHLHASARPLHAACAAAHHGRRITIPLDAPRRRPRSTQPAPALAMAGAWAPLLDRPPIDDQVLHPTEEARG